MRSEMRKQMVAMEMMDGITAFIGPTRSGKSTRLIQETIHCLNGGKRVLFISTEELAVHISMRIRDFEGYSVEYINNLSVIYAHELKSFESFKRLFSDYNYDAVFIDGIGQLFSKSYVDEFGSKSEFDYTILKELYMLKQAKNFVLFFTKLVRPLSLEAVKALDNILGIEEK